MSVELAANIQVQKKVGGNRINGKGLDITSFYLNSSIDTINIKNIIPLAPVPSDYTFYYKFEDNLIDEGGTYIPVIAGTITYGAGQVNRGLEFLTTGGNYFDITSIQSQEFSISLWWKYRATTTVRLVSEEFNASGNDNESGLYIGKYLTNDLLFQTSDGLLDNFGRVTIPSTSFIEGQWNHFVFTSNNTTKLNKAFVNGIEVGSEIRPTTISYIADVTRSTPFRVNATYTNLSEINSMDELIHYNRVLTDQEILDIYNIQKGI